MSAELGSYFSSLDLVGRSVCLNSPGCNLCNPSGAETRQHIAAPHLGGGPERKHSPLGRRVLHQWLMLPSRLQLLPGLPQASLLDSNKLTLWRLLVQERRLAAASPSICCWQALKQSLARKSHMRKTFNVFLDAF